MISISTSSGNFGVGKKEPGGGNNSAGNSSGSHRDKARSYACFYHDSFIGGAPLSGC